MDDIKNISTPNLVREFASLKVWFAVNEVDGPVMAGTFKHRRLCAIVDELRIRRVLD